MSRRIHTIVWSCMGAGSMPISMQRDPREIATMIKAWPIEAAEKYAIHVDEDLKRSKIYVPARCIAYDPSPVPIEDAVKLTAL